MTEKAYIIIYIAPHWEPRECEVVGKSKDRFGLNLYHIQYSYRNQTKKATVPAHQLFTTVEAAREFAKRYELTGA